tara:strand:- start:367 stop:741 length:375 start_codon:yes stop_codon:yes gene_type:complete
MEWYLKVMRENYANFNGRARRKEYWMFTLFYSLLVTACAFALALLVATGSQSLTLLVAIISIAAILAHVVPSIAVTVRRLHDVGQSGWFLLLAFIPYIGNLIIFVFSVIEGNKGTNKYGPDPKA